MDAARVCIRRLGLKSVTFLEKIREVFLFYFDGTTDNRGLADVFLKYLIKESAKIKFLIIKGMFIFNVFY